MLLKALCCPPGYTPGGGTEKMRKGFLTSPLLLIRKNVFVSRENYTGTGDRGKIILAMKLTAIILLMACLAAGARGSAQQITLSVKDASLLRVIGEIEKQSGVSFIYSKGLIEKSGKITLSVQQQPITVVLELIFKDQPLAYRIADNYVVLSPKQAVAVTPGDNTIANTAPPPLDIKGRVVNEKNEPVIATVSEKGTQKAVTTNDQGYFEMTGLDPNATIVITGVSIERMEIKLSGRSELATLSVKTKTTPLDDVQVIAYGTTSKRFNVGAVSSITSKEIEKQPVTNVLLTLQGQVPGLLVTPSGGAPGSATLVQVRGQNTVRPSRNNNSSIDQPLILVDGVPFASQNKSVNLIGSLGSSESFGALAGISGLNNINPSDIESISVLKDADATSIYGSQGANGVILITTKKGIPGKADFNLTINTGPNKATNNIELLNTQEYLDLRREAFRNDGVTIPTVFTGTNPDLLLYDQTRYTNWFKQFFGKTSNNTDVYSSIRGGSANTTFILSAGYNHTTFNFPGDFALDRFTLHSGYHYNSVDRKFNMDFGTDVSYSRNNNSQRPAVATALQLPPNFPDMLDESGNLVWNYKGYELAGNQQYSYLKRPYLLRQYNLINSLRFSYQVINGLEIIANIGYSRLNTIENTQTPISSQSPATVSATGSATFGKNEFETINLEPQVNYRRAIGKGVLTSLAGGTYKRNNSAFQTQNGGGYPNDALLGSISGAAAVTHASNVTIYKYVGVYGRIGYIYDNKYIVNLTGRRDGSSNFGPGNKFGNFGSAGAGWIVSEESFFERTIPVMSFLKLSVNYGTNGSDGIAPYNYQRFWSINSSVPAFQGMRPYNPRNLYNPDYSWASKRSWNFSADLGFFKDRLLINSTLYRSRTTNQLTDNLLPGQTGFTSVVGNMNATVQNQGWELSITSENIKGKNFSWSTNFNFTINRNKLIEFFELEKSSFATVYTIGRSINTINGYLYKGVNDTSGLFEFYTGKGGTTYAPSSASVSSGGDWRPIADLQPKYYGGLGNTLTYKGLSLSFFFQFSKQTARNFLYALYINTVKPGGAVNMPVQVWDRWRQRGDQALLQRATQSVASAANTTAFYFTSSSGTYSDASYIRLKNVSISYNLPAAIAKKAGMKGCRIYVNAQNLLTFTKYRVGDPELPGQLGVMPMQRIIAGGLSFNF